MFFDPLVSCGSGKLTVVLKYQLNDLYRVLKHYRSTTPVGFQGPLRLWKYAQWHITIKILTIVLAISFTGATMGEVSEFQFWAQL